MYQKVRLCLSEDIVISKFALDRMQSEIGGKISRKYFTKVQYTVCFAAIPPPPTQLCVATVFDSKIRLMGNAAISFFRRAANIGETTRFSKNMPHY